MESTETTIVAEKTEFLRLAQFLDVVSTPPSFREARSPFEYVKKLASRAAWQKLTAVYLEFASKSIAPAKLFRILPSCRSLVRLSLKFGPWGHTLDDSSYSLQSLLIRPHLRDLTASTSSTAQFEFDRLFDRLNPTSGQISISTERSYGTSRVVVA